MGSDEFGGAILMHAPEPDMQWVVGCLSHIEDTHAGQSSVNTPMSNLILY